MELNALLEEAARRGASDIHLVDGEPPVFRLGGALERQTKWPTLTASWFRATLLPALPEPARQALEEERQPFTETELRLDSVPVIFLFTVFRTHNGLAASVRVLSNEIPTLDQIGGDALDVLREIALLPRGFVLITGPTGSGKLTTASSLVDHINRTRAERIYVLEESRGYVWTNCQSLVTTLRVGSDYDSYDSYERAAQALQRGADPNVVYFTDLPNAEAIRQALTLAETGYLVVANLNAESPAAALEYLIDSLCEPRVAVRALLARTLTTVFCQRLLPRAERPGRVPLYEILQATPPVRDILRTGGSMHDLDAVAQSGEGGSRSRDAALDRLLAQGEISDETAAAYRTTPAE